jgi:hypothetical protein
MSPTTWKNVGAALLLLLVLLLPMPPTKRSLALSPPVVARQEEAADAVDYDDGINQSHIRNISREERIE